MAQKTVTVVFTDEESAALDSLCISMESKLKQDKHANTETIEFWYKMHDKIMMARIRQLPNN